MKITKFFFGTTKRIVLSAVGALVVVIIVSVAISKSKGTAYQFVTVKRGDITEIVSVTGNTTSTKSVSLAFQGGGIITSVLHQAGDTVHAGDLIATVDSSDLEAQLKQAQASVDAQTANLQKLQVGPTQANVAVSEANLAAAQQNLQNAYLSVPNIISDAYSKSNDAVRNQISSFFTNGETNNPVFNISVNDSQAVNNAVAGRLLASTALNAWQVVLPSLATSSNASLDTALQKSGSYLVTVKQLLETVAHAVTEANNLPAATLATYQTEVTAALNEVNTASTNVQNAIQNIASEKAAVAQQNAQLQLTLASSTPQDIAAQEAQVEQAEANVLSIQSKLRQTSIVSPINGVVTVQNAKIGQIASPGVELISIISNSQFEIDADIPEIDIGKVNIGDAVSMTLDAFPNETFTGKLFYVNPAETVTGGVVDYETKISFDKPDPRMKSGLTVNCDIATQTNTSTLILPQYAVLQNDQGTFVETVTNGKTNQVPVKLGIQDQDGNVEIVSGVTEGEQVVNIGLKVQ